MVSLRFSWIKSDARALARSHSLFSRVCAKVNQPAGQGLLCLGRVGLEALSLCQNSKAARPVAQVQVLALHVDVLYPRGNVKRMTPSTHRNLPYMCVLVLELEVGRGPGAEPIAIQHNVY